MKSKLKRSDLLTPVEVSALMRASRQLHQKALIEFLLESGCRIGEALSLTVRDIEIDESFITVSVDGKTGPRSIPLLKSNLPIFLIYISTLDKGKIFPWTYNAINGQFKRIYKKANVKRPLRLLHIFRHMKCTHLLESGIPEVILRRFMGWSEYSNMVAYYSHLDTHSMKDYFSRLYGITHKSQEPLYPKDILASLSHIFTPNGDNNE